MDGASQSARRKEWQAEKGPVDDTVWYHGTSSQNVDAFDLSKSGQSQSHKKSSLPGVSLATGKGYASVYGQNVIPVYVRASKILDLTDLDQHVRDPIWNRLREAGVKTTRSAAVPAYNGKDYLTRTYEYLDAGGARLAKQIQDAGYDAIKYVEPANGTTLHVSDPTNIRRTDATFDPSQSGSSKLLAGVSGLGGVGLISAAATMPKDEKKKPPR